MNKYHVILIIILVLLSFGLTVFEYESEISSKAKEIKRQGNYIIELENYSIELYDYYNETYRENVFLIEQNEKLFKTNYFLEAEKSHLLSGLTERFDYTWTGCNENNPDWVFKPQGKWKLICSKSMRPVISCEHTLYFCKVNGGDELNIGDIILFKTDEYNADYTIHRIVDFVGNRIKTKGDNNFYADQTLLETHQVLGKLYKIEA